VSGEGTETSYFYVTCLINVKTGKLRCASLSKAVRSGCSTLYSIGQAFTYYDLDSLFEHSHLKSQYFLCLAEPALATELEAN